MAVDVISKLFELFYGHANLPWFKVGEGEVCQVISNGPILEYGYVVFCPEYALFQWLWRLILGYQPEHAFEYVGIVTFAQSFQ